MCCHGEPETICAGLVFGFFQTSNDRQLEENVHKNGTNQSTHVEGGVNLLGTADGIRPHEELGEGTRDGSPLDREVAFHLHAPQHRRFG